MGAWAARGRAFGDGSHPWVFYRAVREQSTATCARAMATQCRAPPEHSLSLGSFRAKGSWANGVRNYKTLSALGRWFDFELEAIASGLVGSAGCKIPGLVWFLP